MNNLFKMHVIETCSTGLFVDLMDPQPEQICKHGLED